MDPELKACVFGGLIVAMYTVHQVTVGGDGAIFGGVLAALGVVGGYAFGRYQNGQGNT